MIIPVRCFCGEVLADKWIPYVSAVQEEKNKINEELDPKTNNLDLRYIDVKNPKPEKVLKERY